MKTSDFFYDLPKELIAQTPLSDRASSRLLLLDKNSGAISHKTFRDIVGLIDDGDCVVFNDTRVIPARLIGRAEKGTHAPVEILLLENKGERVWETLAKPGKRTKKGDVITFSDMLSAEIIDILDDGNRMVKFIYDGVFEEILDNLGEMPLPPYITGKLNDKARYQTVYAKNDGSAAAPTAGLHFTDAILDALREKGVNSAYVTLHVGLGTFRPVRVDEPEKHKMHSERFTVDARNAAIINETRRNGKKIIAVGTTTARTLESAAGEDGFIAPSSGRTEIFIYPPYQFKMVDALITNFHLPESTLIMLVSALAGRENTLNAYRAAVLESYRFFSFGDAMFIY